MTISSWFRLLRENNFSIAPSRLPLALSVSIASVVNSMFACTQQVLYRKRIHESKTPDDPVFVVGHWRSGTTLLHELLTLDPNHTYPDTYACLAPSHFLVSKYLVPWWLGLLMPKRRPMDNVRIGWNQPQEDEWIFCLQGLPSVYRNIAFPRRLPHCTESLTLDDLGDEVRARWNNELKAFINKVMLGREDKKLVLKSPTHTARVGHLYRMFPRAKFVHVYRDPMSVFPSTIRLWTKLADDHGLQLTEESELRPYVLETFKQLYAAFESQRQVIPQNQICDVAYEKLVQDPVAQLEQIYERLELGSFETVRPLVEKRQEAMSDYQTNRYQLADEDRRLVSDHWNEYCTRYGYPITKRAA